VKFHTVYPTFADVDGGSGIGVDRDGHLLLRAVA